MSKEKIYPEGIKTFAPRDGAPDFVKGAMVITPNDLVAWLHNNKELMSDYNDKKQLRLDILEGDKGLYLTVNTWKPNK